MMDDYKAYYECEMKRADKAEDALAALSDDMDDVHEALGMAWAERDAAIARAEAAEKRVAELEAQLAQEWRPVTEPPSMMEDWYLTYNKAREDFDDPGFRISFIDGITGWEHDCTHYAPLTPPPSGE